MQPAGLNLDQAPPIGVPFRFFLTAPLFALLAAAVMLWHGPELFASRWSPATLAVVHLLTLGSMTMVMVGAMMQILPVLAGAPVASPRLIAGIIYPSLVLGTLLFAAGFLFGQPLLLRVALPLLGAGLGIFILAIGRAFCRIRSPNTTVVAIWLATAAFGVTLLFGLLLGAGHAWGAVLPSGALHNLHPAWGLLGWTGLLVAGTAYQVVPMFQVTPNYPRWLMRGFAATVFALLVLLTLVQWQGGAAWPGLTCVVLLVLAHIGFAALTLRLQFQRRRRLPDVTLEFWRVGMVCVALAALLAASQRIPVLVFAQADVVLGVLMIVGAALSLITGMLYKIVPFLTWFHLQALPENGVRPPNMKAMLPEKSQRLQLRVHLAALVLCVAAALWPAVFAWPAALCFGAAAVILQLNVVHVARLYRQFAKR